MELGPIWRAMMQSKGGYILIALQIAVTMAIMVNAIRHHAGTIHQDGATKRSG